MSRLKVKLKKFVLNVQDRQILSVVRSDGGTEWIIPTKEYSTFYERRIEQDKLNHIHLDVLFKAMYREKTRVYRAQKKLLIKEERV